MVSPPRSYSHNKRDEYSDHKSDRPRSRRDSSHNSDRVERVRHDNNHHSSSHSRDKKRSYSSSRTSDSHKVEQVKRSSPVYSKAKLPNREDEIIELILGRTHTTNFSRFFCKDIAFACKRLADMQDIRSLDNDMLIGLLKQAIDRNANCQDIAMILNNLGKLTKNAQGSFSPRIMPALCTLIESLLSQNPNEQDISNSVLGLSKFVECNLPLAQPAETMHALSELVALLSHKKPDSQNISNTVHGLSKIVEQGYKIANTEKTMTALCTLTRNLPRNSPNDQAITNTVLGLSKFIEREYKLDREDETMKALCTLVERLSSCKPTAKAISCSLMGLSKFIDAEYKLPNAMATPIQTLVRILVDLNPEPQSIALTIHALSKFTEKEYIRPPADELMSMIAWLINHPVLKTANSQEISMIVLGMGKFVERNFPIYQPETTMATLCRLAERLPHVDPIEQNIANTILGLGKFVERGFVVPDKEATSRALSLLIRLLPQKTPNEQNIYIAIHGLSKFVDREFALDQRDATMSAVCTLVLMLPQESTCGQAISNTIHGLSKFVGQGYKLHQERETLQAICSLAHKLPDNDPNDQNIATTLRGLGKLVECGYQIEDRELMMRTLSTLIITQAKNSPNAQDICLTINGFSKFVEKGFEIYDQEAVMKALSLLIKSLEINKELQAQHTSLAILGLSKIIERGYTLYEPDVMMESLTSFVLQLPNLNSSAQEIGNTVHGISRFIEQGYPFAKSDEVLKTLSELVKSLPRKNPNALNIALTVLGLSKFIEKKFPLHDPDATVEALCTLIQRLPHENPNDQNIANTINGISKFIEQGYRLANPEKTIEALTSSASQVSEKASAQDISLIVLGLSKLVEVGYDLPNPSATIKALVALIELLPQKELEAPHISCTVIGMSRFLLRYGYEIPPHCMRTLRILIERLPAMNPHAKAITATLLGIGRFAEHGYAIKTSKACIEAICELIKRLPSQNPKSKSISIALLGFGKVIDSGCEISDIDGIMAAQCSLIKSMSEQKKSGQQIANALNGLSHSLKYGYKLDDVDATMAAITKLACELQEHEPDWLHTSLTMLALGTFVRYGYTLHEPETLMSRIRSQIIRLIEFDPDALSTALTLFGAGFLAKHGYSFDEKTLSALITLTRRMPTKKPTAQQISMILKAVSFLKIASNDVLITVEALLEDLKAIRLENVHICETLFALSEIGFQDNEDWANRLIKHISWHSKHKRSFTTPNIVVQGILGYARLMTKAPDDAAKNAVLTLYNQLQRKKMPAQNALALIQAYTIFKEKGAEALTSRIDIDLIRKKFLAADPTKEEKELAGITEEEQVAPPSQQAPLPIKGLCEKTHDTVQLTSMPKPPSYDLSTKKGQQDLKEHLAKKGIEFVAEDVPLRISPIYVLQNELGAFAQKTLQPGHLLGNYVGKRVVGEEAIKESMYAFDITENDEGEEVFIDAATYRNFAAFLNHSTLANIATTPQMGTIRFQVASEPILENEQCFINYGEDFFSKLSFNPIYFDPHDSWESFDELVLQNRDAYEMHAAYVNAELQKAFNLPTQKVLLTKLSAAILTGSEEEALKLIDSQADLPSYCVDNTNTIMAPQKQQRISSLSLACYLGKTNIVQALLQKCNRNARMLQTGETPAFFALKGKAENRSELFKLLLDHGIYYNQVNREGVSLLNLAVEENLREAVQLLLDGKSKEERDELLDTFANSQTDSLYAAIVSGKLEAAKALLKKTTQTWLAPKIVERELLILKALEETAYFDMALEALMDAGNIHKNFAVTHAIMTRFGSKANKLLEEALQAKQWPTKEREKLEAFKTV